MNYTHTSHVSMKDYTYSLEKRTILRKCFYLSISNTTFQCEKHCYSVPRILRL